MQKSLFTRTTFDLISNKKYTLKVGDMKESKMSISTNIAQHFRMESLLSTGGILKHHRVILLRLV